MARDQITRTGRELSRGYEFGWTGSKRLVDLDCVANRDRRSKTVSGGGWIAEQVNPPLRRSLYQHNGITHR